VIPDDLADVLIPAVGGMPSATEAGATGVWLDRVLSARPDLAAELGRIVAPLAGQDPRAAVDRLARERPADLDTLLSALAGAYYMSDDVRHRLAYPGQRAIAADAEDREPPLDLDSPLLGPVRARGPIYRNTD
jgi:hypothetical protein